MRSLPNQARLYPTGRRLWALARVAAVAMLLAGLAPVNTVTADTFDDVPPPPWAVTFIDTVTTAPRVMEGCGGPFFCPYEVVTREDMAVWLERGMHGASYTPPPVTTSTFADVDPDYCLAPWFERLYADQITAGCALNPRRFCPYMLLTRAHIAYFLLRAEHGPNYIPPSCTGVFADVPCPGGYLVDWIEQFYREGITSGCGTNPPVFCPDNQLTRAEMAVFMVRTFGLQ